jgi:hypothetical protein
MLTFPLGPMNITEILDNGKAGTIFSDYAPMTTTRQSASSNDHCV